MAHILVIDDENEIRTMVAMILEHEGYEVTVAENGKIGMARFRAKPADLVITDLVMPEQEGVETIMQLRREFPKLPVIAMSGGIARSETYLDICRRLGVRGTLAKPFGMAELLALVKPALESKSS
jgi:DNA-binding response OmpR family regulator